MKEGSLAAPLAGFGQFDLEGVLRPQRHVA